MSEEEPTAPPGGSSSRLRRARRSRTFKFGLGFVVAVTITGSIVAALTFSTSTPNVPLLNLPVPQFNLQSLVPGDRGISSARLRGRTAIVLNFWGSWCPPCKEEMPALQAAHRELGRDVTFVGIDEEDTRPAAISFLRSVGVTYPSGFDGNGTVAAAFRINGTPTTYFISHGRMLDFHEGRLNKRALLTYVHQIFGVS